MKLLQHPHPCHEQRGKPHHHKDKKGHKIMRKMAKLEKKLSKYTFDSDSDQESCSSAASVFRSRSLSRSRKQRTGRHQRKHSRRFASRDRSSSSDSSSNDDSNAESSGSSSSSSSSRSPSPCDRRFHHHHDRHQRHHHGPAAHLSRSKSFAGRGNRSVSPFSRGPHHRHQHHHHPHPHPAHPHHRGRFWHHRCRRFQDGLRGIFNMLSPDDECDKSANAANGADQPDLMDLVSPSRSVSREPEERLPSASVEVDQDTQAVEQDGAEQAQDTALDETLTENWTKIIREGLPSEVKNALSNKYPVSEKCSMLKGPKLNPEILPVATETGVKKDIIYMHQQNQIGTGLAALGKAITDLNNRTDLKKDEGVIEILEGLNEAGVIIVDAHRRMTKTRQAFMQSELKKRVGSIVANCQHDEFLYGKDFDKKIENVKGFGKSKRSSKKHEREGRNKKGEKRKHCDQDVEGRKSKHSNSRGVEKLTSSAGQEGPKIVLL